MGDVGGRSRQPDFEFAIEGTVEGPLRDAEQTGEDAPTTLSLNLLTWPERQLLLNKRYRPLPSSARHGPPFRQPGNLCSPASRASA